MKALDLLMSEHRLIEAMLAIVDDAATRADRGEVVSPEVFADAIEFFRTLADGCHHAKEEGILFPLLAARGFGLEMSVVGALLAQHDAGRAHIRAMQRALADWEVEDVHAPRALAASAKAYVEVLREHIRIEDVYFYDLAAGLLTEADDRVLVDGFEQVEHDRVGKGVHERFERMLDKYGAAPKTTVHG